MPVQNTKRIYKRDFKDKREDVWRQDQGLEKPNEKQGQDINAEFVDYYQKQQIVPEGEWEKF